MRRAKVVFLCPYVKQYRIPFFDRLYRELHRDGIEMRVLYGHPNGLHAVRRDTVIPPSLYSKPVKSYWIADRVVFQSAWRELSESDLVITPNEAKALVNPLITALRIGGVRRVAFWGKGNVRPAGISNPAEWLRYNLAHAADWWFAYTEETAANLRKHGVRCGITSVGNSTDTSALRRDLDEISDACLAGARASLGIQSGPVAIYCGNLSPNKRLDFLLDAATRIRQFLPNFSLLVIGNGPLREHVEFAAAHERFIHYLGPRSGLEKALFLKLSDVFLLPGAVGLAILDAFSAGLPLITTQLPDHGPEIDYLSPGHDGLITSHNPVAYADAVIALMSDSRRLANLRAGALESGERYGIEEMVENFRRGIHECLNTPARGKLETDSSWNRPRTVLTGGQS